MSEHLDKTMSVIDHCFEDVTPHQSAQEIARVALANLMESVEEGWLTEEDAQAMHRRWFGEPGTD